MPTAVRFIIIIACVVALFYLVTTLAQSME